MAENKDMILKIKADVKDAKKSLASIIKELKGIDTSGKKTGAGLTGAFNKAGASVKNFGKTMTSIQGIMGGMMVKGIYDMATAQRKLAMQTVALRSNKAFGGLANDFNNIEQSTQGMVNQFEIVGSVNKALAFGIDLSGGKLNRLIKAAQRASIVMGTDLKTSFEDLIVASGRQSRLIADNLGVVMSVGDANKNYAKQLGVTAKSLTAAQQKTAFLNEFLMKLEDSYKHLGDAKLYDPIIAQQKRLANAWQKTKSGFTQLIGWAVKKTESGAEDLASAWSSSDDQIIETEKKKIRKLMKQYTDHYTLDYKEFQNVQWEKQDLSSKNWKELVDISKKYSKLIRDEEHKELKAVMDKGSMLAKYYNLLTKTKKLESGEVSVRGSARGSVGPASQSPASFKFSKDDLTKMRKYRENKAEKAKTRAIAIQDAKRELKLINESGIYSEKEIFLLNQKLLKLQAIGKTNKIIVDIGTKKGLSRLAKEEQDKKDAEDRKLQIQKDAEKLSKEVIQAGYDFEKSAFDNHQREMKARRKQENKEKDEERKIQLNRKNRIEQMQISASHTMAKGAIDALIALDEKLFLQSIASAAATAGQQIFMDGLTTLWKGTAKNALFPGLGVNAMGVGLTEIGIGTGLMAGAGFASNAIGSSGGSSSGAQERNEEASKDQTIQNDVRVSLYPSRTAMKKDFTNNGVIMKG